ncbi:uncharacterized protein LOC126908779 isoform X4 [Daktulosphaira vitifoliae]|uniref:uncharacterized protein LOC126908779 isoform X4 n=1 Tax=Daktulosphaira vitifoliae TaxID=58002 RepID=UPI0021AAEF72|nr:uncharacterized protein LOC126908779 isoform X4 [Daktulosphaira vitifoliae]
MNYPVLLSLSLFFFTAYGIPADNQKEEPDGIPADNQNDKPCDIHGEDQNEERDNLNEEPCDIQGDDRIADQTCSVCWDNNPDTSIGVCTHKFCKGCIDTWKFDKISYRCPLCNYVYDNPDFEEDVNIINHNLIGEMLQNFDYIVRNSDYYNLDHNRTFQETINELVEELNLINTTSDNTGTSIMPFEVTNDLNILAENMRIINRTSPYNANDFSEVIRIIHAFPYNSVNTLAEAMRNINRTS